MKRLIRRLLLLGLAGVVMMHVFTFGSNVAYAAGGGGVGSSGTGGSSSSGGYYTYYNPGWGWRNYSVTDSGPPGGFLNGSWADAQAACSGYSTNILVFTLSSSSGVIAGRDYKTIYYSPGTYKNYRTNVNDGPASVIDGNYVSVPAAHAAYNALPASIKGSTTFGVDVGWFCYGILPTNPNPQGSYDALDCTYAQGWAFDSSKSSQSIRVDVQVDGDTKLWEYANGERSDVNAAYGITGNHGFKDDISAWVSDGGTHTVEPFMKGIDSSGKVDELNSYSLGKKSVGPCRTYTLTPTVNILGLTTASAGNTISMTYNVQNAQSSGTQSGSTGWGLREVTIPAGVAIPAAFATYKDGSSGCAYFTSFGSGITCNEISTAATSGVTQSQVFPGSPGGTTTTITSAMLSNPTPANIAMFSALTIPASATPGSHICRVLSVLPRNQGGTYDGASLNNRDSALACVLVASSPYVALVGGSSWAGGATTSPYSGVAGFRGATGTNFGSFGEYGLFATGAVSNFGSGGEYWNTGASSGMNPGTQLTFANSTSFGSYNSVHAISDQVARYAASSNNAGVLDAGGHIVQSGVYVDKSTTGTLTLNSGNFPSSIPAGVHAVVYVPNKTVVIAGNITYATGGVTSFGQLASLTVIAKNITVNGSVTQIAGWFYATNSFVSCSEGATSVARTSITISATGTCSKQLTVNGAISVARQTSDNVVLNRSYGGQAAGQAAEIIRMRPEAFLTPYEAGNNPSSMILTTVQETELPARY